MFVKERFELDQYTCDLLSDMESPFGNSFGEFLFYRTYSRNIDGHQENWADCIIRVINGVMSIRKDHYVKNHIFWDQKYWKEFSRELAISAFKMQWLPPGRGLWAMGTDFIYERGAMALYNCGATDIYFKDLSDDIGWLMDSLMLGVGVGFGPTREDGFKFKHPKGSFEFIIPDSREGWVDSVKEFIEAYSYGSSKPRFIYDEIRPKGLPIKGFGGISSGPEPLKEFHIQLENNIERYMTDKYYDSILLKTDIANQCGCMVVSGNVRRSAELAYGPIYDETFKNLRNYELYPEREAHSWMSNNSVTLFKNKDFERLGEIADKVINGEDLGYLNLRNFKYGRIGKKDKVKKDKAKGINPCGEIPLQGGYLNPKDKTSPRVRETCNVDETFPTVCESPKEWYQACKYATFYCSTVSLLPTHQPSTNIIVARNRRIGVSLVDYTGWIEEEGVSKVTKYLRKGYNIVRKENRKLNGEAGVPEAIRVTTGKPGGTVPRLAGKTPGAGYPNFLYILRRVRVQRNHPLANILKQANIPYEADYFSKNTDVYEFPLPGGPAPPAEEISLWQQAMNLVLLQREWADNAISITLNYRPKWKLIKAFSIFNGSIDPESEARKWIARHADEYDHNFFFEALSNLGELTSDNYKLAMKINDNLEAIEIKFYEYDSRHEEDSIEPVLATIAPLTKSVSLLPHSPKGAYKQQPEEGITEREYELRSTRIKQIDWSQFSGSDGQDEKFCNSDICEIQVP